MRPTIWRRRGAGPEGGLSLFLALYVTGLIGALLAIHALQPASDGPESTWQWPAHQQRQKAAKPPARASLEADDANKLGAIAGGAPGLKVAYHA